MSKSTLNQLQYDDRIAKRAKWEAFRFSQLDEHSVQVVNGSHANPEEHSYRVELDEGIPVGCACPSWEYHQGACKHMVAVALFGSVFQQPGEEATSPLLTDGGQLTSGKETEACPNGDELCVGPDGEDLPCFPCYVERNEGA